MQTPPFGGTSSVLASNGSSLNRWIKRFLIVIAATLLIWAAFSIFTSFNQSIPDDAVIDEPDAPTVDVSPLIESRLASYSSLENLNSTDIDILPNSLNVTGFSLTEDEDSSIPAVSEENNEALLSALNPFIDNDFGVGFVFMDIQTGRGFAYNVDEPIYGASSFKGPFCAFYAANYIDEGYAKLSDASDNLFNTIVYSNNISYWKIRRNIDDGDVAIWLDKLGIDTDVAYDTNFPTYTTRDSAKLWLATYEYLQSDSAAAKQLRKYFSTTDTSMIRRALNGSSDDYDTYDYQNDKGDGSVTAEELFNTTDGDEGDAAVSDAISYLVSDGGSELVVEANSEYVDLGSVIVDYAVDDEKISVVEYPFGTGAVYTMVDAVENMGTSNVTVYDKAGWYPRDENDSPAMVDAGIIECNGRDYLMCVMSEMPWSSPNRKTFESLVKAIFETRENLA